ncbi:MAG: LacI family DNA-binding transcriptional regulator [Schaalia hyovaginalis]|uniref:LacI family DNA-binding transcriptional regulator n=1 Tax=Schaalia hyovaginalis TaxID=29316 RepID=UPI002A90B18F|nr:LacI family DNA-binding transcriptional regulator [Schaalia hyovaginalis]MDY5506647.1 LacI family DNA-binding transcriptional regulator [Schaalia hyovaginalis]
MSVTLREVAALAQVSIKTVSNVVNSSANVRPETREKVERAIRTLGYRPNLSARSLRSGKSHVISLVVPEIGLNYFAQLAEHITESAAKAGYSVQLEQTGGDRSKEIAMLSSPQRVLADGLIFSPLGMSQDDEELLRVEYPMVLLGERIFNGPVDHVTMRNVDAAAAATRHLIAAGRRRIAVIGAHANEKLGSAALRFKGYKSALSEAGIPYDPRLVGYTDLWHSHNGAHAMRELLSSGIDFDAVFAMNDALGIGVIRALNEVRRRIPDEVAVIGFDNVTEGEFSMPSLSSVDPGRAEIAEVALSFLLERIENGESAPQKPREHLVDFKLVPRETP